MIGNMQLTLTACYSLAKAIQTISGLSVGVSVFPAKSLTGTPAAVAPLLHHGERLHTRFTLRPSGETPLAQCLWRVMQVMLPLREARKIILILTDGLPDSLPLAQTAIADANRSGYEVYGIGICQSLIAQLLPGKSREIHSIEELTPALFSLLQNILLKK